MLYHESVRRVQNKERNFMLTLVFLAFFCWHHKNCVFSYFHFFFWISQSKTGIGAEQTSVELYVLMVVLQKYF